MATTKDQTNGDDVVPTDTASHELHPGGFARVQTYQGRIFDGRVQSKDAHGLTLDHFNSDFKRGERGKIITEASVFLPWSSIITYDLFMADDEDSYEGLPQENDTDDGDDPDFAFEHDAMRWDKLGPVTIRLRDGETAWGWIIELKPIGVHLRTAKDRSSIVPWVNIRSVEWFGSAAS